jgi:hypothetical protein
METFSVNIVTQRNKDLGIEQFAVSYIHISKLRFDSRIMFLINEIFVNMTTPKKISISDDLFECKKIRLFSQEKKTFAIDEYKGENNFAVLPFELLFLILSSFGNLYAHFVLRLVCQDFSTAVDELFRIRKYSMRPTFDDLFSDISVGVAPGEKSWKSLHKLLAWKAVEHDRYHEFYLNSIDCEIAPGTVIESISAAAIKYKKKELVRDLEEEYNVDSGFFFYIFFSSKRTDELDKWFHDHLGPMLNFRDENFEFYECIYESRKPLDEPNLQMSGIRLVWETNSED